MKSSLKSLCYRLATCDAASRHSGCWSGVGAAYASCALIEARRQLGLRPLHGKHTTIVAAGPPPEDPGCQSCCAAPCSCAPVNGMQIAAQHVVALEQLHLKVRFHELVFPNYDHAA